MHKLTVIALFAGLLAGPARADETADARAIIAKAVQAEGGEAKLAQFHAATFKAKGKFYGLGQALDFTAEYATQPPKKFRTQVTADANGMNFTFTQVVNGDKGWTKLNDTTMDMPPEALTEAKEQVYATWVTRLLPLLKEEGFKLSPLGESKVGDRPAVGVRVAHKDHRDVNLFFDKDKGLLLKSETRVKDAQGGGAEMTQESLFADYKEVQGVQHAFKSTIKRDGKDYVDSEITELKLLDKLDDSVFDRP